MKMLPFNIVTRNGKIVWKHETSLKNLYVMLKFTEQPKTLGITSKKHGIL